MSIRGIVDSARSLSYYMRLQEVLANNLANANTDAFKVDRLTAQRLPGAEHPVAVQTTDFQQGALRDTGRPLDVGLEGPGFLVVRTEAGERLMRGGSLRLDADGWLTDTHGNPVLSEDGPLLVLGAEIEFAADGTVSVDGAKAGRLRIVAVEDPQRLLKDGGNRYIAEQPLVKPGHGEILLRQGAIEDPNLNPLLSMVDLIGVQRAYSANADALKAMDGVLGVLTEVGRP